MHHGQGLLALGGQLEEGSGRVEQGLLLARRRAVTAQVEEAHAVGYIAQRPHEALPLEGIAGDELLKIQNGQCGGRCGGAWHGGVTRVDGGAGTSAEADC